MKALQLVPAMEEGGVERYLTTLNRILVGGGWDDVVVSCGGRLDGEISADGGRTAALDLRSKNPLTAPLRAWRLRRLILEEKPDVVVAHSRVPAWLFLLARSLDRILDLRRSIEAIARHGVPRPRSSAIASTFNLRCSTFLTYAHGANSVNGYSKVMTAGEIVMCPSRFLRDYLKRAYSVPDDRFRVIPHAVDFSRFDPQSLDSSFIAGKRAEWSIGRGDLVVMCVGRITPVKGIDNLIEEIAASRLPEETPVKLVVVGAAEKKHEGYFRELRDESERAVGRFPGRAFSVVFAGAQAKIAECLSIADVVVSANVSKPESFGLAMAEALAMGKPVVAKGFGGALDIVRDGVNGVLCDRGGFAAAIEKARKLPTAEIRDDARRRFDYGLMTSETLSVYKAVTKR